MQVGRVLLGTYIPVADMSGILIKLGASMKDIYAPTSSLKIMLGVNG